ncbi:UNVERIFIED_CONTAM: hypothetical protein Sradi_2515100 [Sesamum radiatum]|uniref:Retrotransposon Copia-like N-terminal domain-containing protein n=1 Tax=Sesamum radiatum TaxID=300843 RepID=A0AAW2SKD3_SESRA
MDRKFYNFSAQTIEEWYSYPHHLTCKNFLAWSKAVKRALGAKMKYGFITGTCKKPSGDPELIEQWTRVDCMVASWLLNAITVNLERDIASITQGDLTKADYFTKIQMLWDELAQLRPMPECTCGCACTCDLANATTALVEQWQLIQFLMGLNDKYDNDRSQILVIEPRPSVNRAYSMILRVKRQRQVHLDVTVRHDGAVMHAGNFEKRKDGNNFRRKEL